MIAVDTNVLVRLFVTDDAAQAAKARALFDAHADEDDSVWIADVVLAELVWALDRSYGRPRADIVAVLRALAGNATVRLESAASMRQAKAGGRHCLSAPRDTATPRINRSRPSPATASCSARSLSLKTGCCGRATATVTHFRHTPSTTTP